jgi:hypothetical protein
MSLSFNASSIHLRQQLAPHLSNIGSLTICSSLELSFKQHFNIINILSGICVLFCGVVDKRLELFVLE